MFVEKCWQVVARLQRITRGVSNKVHTLLCFFLDISASAIIKNMSQSRIFPFRRVSVDHMVRGVTRVWWQLEPAFNDPGPYYYQLQVGNTGLQNAYDWKNVGGPVTDNYVAYDDEWRNTGGVLISHYRVLLTTSNGAYVSQTVSVFGELEEREWVLSREIVRKERLRHDKVSTPGYLIKAMRYGTPCRTCRDQLTQEVTNFDCPICSGTGFEVGYFPPLPMQCWDLSPQTIQENQDAQMKGTTREQAMVTARTVGFPQIDKGDIWVNAKSDERWTVMGLKVAAAMRGVPIVYEVTLGLIPISSTVYLIEVGGEPPERPGPVLPVEGCGPIPVDHDFGGEDALAYRDATGCDVPDANVFVFRRADYDAALPGLPNRNMSIANTKTRANGRWAQALKLDAGNYAVLFEKFSEYGPDLAFITVTGNEIAESSDPPPPPAPETVQPPGTKKFNENDEFWNI